MTEKIVIHYRQGAAQGGPADSLTPGGRKRTRYLHDNRMSDSLVEYMDALDK